MKNNITLQGIIAAVLIVLLLVIWNPSHVWMPDMMLMAMLIAVLVAFAVFAGFVLREKGGDEREGAHRMLAGRYAFLAGSAVLLIGIIDQAFSHAVDIWLVATLVVMLVTKLAVRIYSDRNL